MKRLSALRIEAGSGEAHAPALNSVSISRADPITPLVAPLKGLPFSTLVLYVHGGRGKMKRSLVSAAIPSPISPVLTSRMLFLSIQNAISFRVDREPYRNDIVIYPQICQIDIDRRCVLFPTFFNRPYLFGRKFNQSSYSSSLKQIRRM